MSEPIRTPRSSSRFDGERTLYIVDTLDDQITAIHQAAIRTTSAATVIATDGALKGPLALTLASNGDFLTVNGGDGNMVEINSSNQWM